MRKSRRCRMQTNLVLRFGMSPSQQDLAACKRYSGATPGPGGHAQQHLSIVRRIPLNSRHKPCTQARWELLSHPWVDAAISTNCAPKVTYPLHTLQWLPHELRNGDVPRIEHIILIQRHPFHHSIVLRPRQHPLRPKWLHNSNMDAGSNRLVWPCKAV